MQPQVTVINHRSQHSSLWKIANANSWKRSAIVDAICNQPGDRLLSLAKAGAPARVASCQAVLASTKRSIASDSK
ncbi:hypothetical protein ACU4GD_34075 [Cupriavidus basilensis]